MDHTIDRPPAAAFEWLKREINLPRFAIHTLGWQRNNNKSTQKALVLSHPEHGTIHVPTAPSSASGYWHFHTPGFFVNKQGTLVDLLLKHQWSWPQITLLSSHYVATTSEQQALAQRTTTLQDPSAQTAAAQEQLQKLIDTPLLPSHLDHLGLTPETYHNYPQLRTNHYQALFSLFKDFHRHPQGRLCSTMAYYLKEGESAHYLQEGLPKGLALLYDTPTPGRLLLTDSPIEALCFKQLEALEKEAAATKTLYIAPCGPLSASQQADLQLLFKSAQENKQSIVLAFSQGEAGQKLAQHTQALLKAQNAVYKTATLPKEHTSWHEALQDSRALDVSLLTQQHLNQFQTAPYEQSLLQRIGLDKDTQEKGQTPLLTSTTEALWGLYKDVATHKRTLVGTYTLFLDQQGALQDHFQSGLQRGLALLDTGVPPQRIVVTESPIEALMQQQALYKDLQQEERLYHLLERSDGEPYAGLPRRLIAAGTAANGNLFVSTCGPLTKSLLHELDKLFVIAREKQLPLTLCLPQAALAPCERLLQGLDYPFATKAPHDWHLPSSLEQLATSFQALATGKDPLIDELWQAQKAHSQTKAPSNAATYSY